jgi:hypothetical protein
MSDHADDRTWTIARLLFATHLVVIVLALAMVVVTGYGALVTWVLVRDIPIRTRVA